MANTKGKTLIVNIATLAGLEAAINSALETQEAGGWVCQDVDIDIISDDAGGLDARAVCVLVHEDYLDAGSSILSTLASVANGEGASLIGVEDAAGNFAATDVEAALAEIITLLASVANGEGASMIGLEDAAGHLVATDVEAGIAEIFTLLASVANTEGASLIGVEDAAGNLAATDVEAALAEIFSLLASNANTEGASLVGIEDAANIITATTVEAALAELAAQQRITVIVEPEFTAGATAETAVPIPAAIACYLSYAAMAVSVIPAPPGAITFRVRRASDDAEMLESAFDITAGVADQNNAFTLQTSAPTQRNLASGESCYVHITSTNGGDSYAADLRIALCFDAGALS